MTSRDGLGLLLVALLVTLVLHGLAMLTMLGLLLPGMPGAGSEAAERVAYVAAHPWRWRLGWLPWQLTAASDVLLGIALWRSRLVPRAAAWLSAALTLAAVVPDQAGQWIWITRGVALAQEAQATGDLTAYLALEQRLYPTIAGWAATLYTFGAIGWTWCFVAARLWNRALTWLSVPLWTIFAVVSPALLLPEGWRIAPSLVAAANGVGFVLMEIWFALVAAQVLRRWRPGRIRWMARWPALLGSAVPGSGAEGG